MKTKTNKKLVMERIEEMKGQTLARKLAYSAGMDAVGDLFNSKDHEDLTKKQLIENFKLRKKVNHEEYLETFDNDGKYSKTFDQYYIWGIKYGCNHHGKFLAGIIDEKFHKRISSLNLKI